MPGRILIIEDEERIARFIELELVHEGYEVDKCTDGRIGLEMAESGKYDAPRTERAGGPAPAAQDFRCPGDHAHRKGCGDG